MVYDTSDPDWTLVGLDGEYGFAPSNYIEITGETAESRGPAPSDPPLPSRPTEPQSPEQPRSEPSPASSPATSLVQTPAANLASILNTPATTAPPPMPQRPAQFTPEESEDEASAPALPQRPASEQRSPPIRQPSPPSPEPSTGPIASPPLNRASRSASDAHGLPSPGGYHLYNINEMVSVMGKQKKMPTTLGINLATGIIMIMPEKKRDGPQQQWTADKLTNYSIEGKHVFMELVKPSKSIDFHAGAKDTATEIVSSLGELAGMSRAEGLREVIAAGSVHKGQKKGHMLYDFMAQGDDEVTVADGDEVIVLDDSQSEEWWKVRRIRNGKEGVVPSSYVEVTGVTSPPLQSPSTAGINAGRSTVYQNRLEEERLAKEAIRASQKQEEKAAKGSEVGPGLRLPNRGSSLMAGQDSNASSSQRSKRDSRADGKSSSAKSSTSPRCFDCHAPAD